MPGIRTDGGSDSEASDEQEKAAALSALGVPAKSAVEARLVLEDLDGDGVAEALFTIECEGANVFLVVLKRKGDQWYRLPSPPNFSCRCNYENSPLNTFVEVRDWSYPFEETSQPLRLIFVRASTGGSGLYERGVEVFALDGFRLRSVFGTIDEELRFYPFPEGSCDLRHVIITFENENGHRALVTREIRRSVNPEKVGLNSGRLRAVGSPFDGIWWVGQPVSACRAYTWNNKSFKFVESTSAASIYCPAAQRAPITTKRQHR